MYLYNYLELDPNHTHFILVDDGSCGMFGKEIEFRAKLESELRKDISDIYYQKTRVRREASRAIGGRKNETKNVNNEMNNDLKKGIIKGEEKKN
jgi:hypothetical protein